jgi:hypothetical protein
MAAFPRPFETLEQLHETRLDGYRRMLEAGVKIAILGAQDYCLDNKIDSPFWLTAAARELTYDALKRDKPKKRGRSAGPLDRYRTDIEVHYSRYSAVIEVREQQEHVKAEVDKLHSLSKVPPALLEQWEYLLRCVGHTLSRAFECAAILVEGPYAGGSVDAIKASYFMVQRLSRDPQQALRFQLLDVRTLVNLGIGERRKPNARTTKLPLYHQLERR